MSVVLSYLNQQKQWNDENDIQHVVDDLNNNENVITTFHLTGNTMGTKAAEKLTEPLSKQSKIEKLLWSDLFTGRGKDQIGSALKALSLGLMRAKVQLVELDLSDNAFGPNGVAGVTDLIANECCFTLKILNMNNQGLGHQGCRALVKAMKSARLESNKQGLNLEVFIAGRNRLENEGMEMLSEVFGDGMNSLKKLVLLQNGIGVYGIRGVESLIVAIRNHKKLKIFNISDNNIKHDGMNLLSDVLPEFENLEELYMDDCLLGKKGANVFSLIAEDRSLCSELKIISMSGNEIKSAAAMNLVNAIIEGKPSIETIDLRENDVKKAIVVEMEALLIKYDKKNVLLKEEVVSDDEEEEEDSDDESSDDASENSEGCEISDDAQENSEGSESSDEKTQSQNESGSHKSEDSVEEFQEKEGNVQCSKTSENISKSPLDKTSGLFSTPKGRSSIFGQSSDATNIFGTPSNARTNLFSTPTTEQSIFKTVPSVTGDQPSFGIFGNNKPITSGSFGNNTGDKPFVGLFGTQTTDKPTGGLFTTKTADKPNGGLFSTKTADKPAGSLFGTKTEDKPTGGLFGTKTEDKPTGGLFGTKTEDKPTGGLFGTKTADKPTGGLFGTKTAEKPAGGLFGTKTENKPAGGLFGTKTENKPAGGLFGTKTEDKPAGGLFGTKIEDKPAGGLFGTKTADKSTNEDKSTESIFGNLNIGNSKAENKSGNSPLRIPVAQKSSIFTNNNDKNKPVSGIFANLPNTQSTVPSTQGSVLFSFTPNVDPTTSQLKINITSCLKAQSLMSMDRNSLKVKIGSQINKTIDSELKKLALSKPENGVRVGLILCEDPITFDLGLTIIEHLLTSEKWAPSTNAMLVEMNCIKSEEMKFVPISNASPNVPIKVLKNLLATTQLPEEVRINFSTILKNLTKVANNETDDLLRDLDDLMRKCSL